MSQTTLVLDTNSLIYAMKQRIDLKNSEIGKLGSVMIVVPSSVIEELRTLAGHSTYAKAAYSYASGLPVIKVDSRRDDGVIEAASRTQGYVLTNDRELSRRCMDKNFGVVHIRGGKILEVKNYRAANSGSL